ncbi:MAG: hypothetical protein EPO24_16045 [Bacteroidetes bacterium]|nr:MAG: hypothetical protein EPO24_16045 [Bacteroidota bacterium]
MIVVSNASPLISLSNAGVLFVLQQLFGTIHITQEVNHEIHPSPHVTEKPVINAEWLIVKSLSNPARLDEWSSQYRLGKGELSTILYAKECSANLVLLDERKARTLAKSHNLPLAGTIGILEESYRRGFLTDLRSAYLHLLDTGTYIDKKILEHSLIKIASTKL